MKRAVFFFLLLTSSASLVYSQGWKQVKSGTTEWLLSLSFPTADIGYAVGWSGTILKTTNGGLTWVKQTSGTVNVLHSVHFLNATQGYVAGEYGTILKTTDGGTSWTDISPGTPEAFLAINFINTNAGFAAGGAFIGTSDGGNTWTGYTSFSDEWFSSLFFINPDTGYATTNKGGIRKTQDGGVHWLEVSHEANSLSSVIFINDTLGFAAGENVHQQGMILKTTDGGSSWVSRSFVFSPLLSSICFPVKDTGFAVGGNGMIFKTTDGGINWTDQLYETPQWFNAVCFTDCQNGIIVATGGLILKTTTGGELDIAENQRKEDFFRIYPNPAKEYLCIKSPPTRDVINLTIIDITGKVRMNRLLTGPETRLYLHDWPGGIYFLKLIHNNKIEIRKFMKE